jgi:hypothetical protein
MDPDFMAAQYLSAYGSLGRWDEQHPRAGAVA